MTFYVYILFSEQINKYYIGYSADPWIRFKQHLTNSKDKFTGKAKDWELKTVFSVGESESTAVSLERFIKRQKSRNLIVRLCDEHFVPTGELAKLVRVPHVRD